MDYRTPEEWREQFEYLTKRVRHAESDFQDLSEYVVRLERAIRKQSMEEALHVVQKRRMRSRFLKLPFQEKIMVVEKICAVDDRDKLKGSSEIFSMVFEEAQRRDLLDVLWDEVESRYIDPSDDNPFRKQSVGEESDQDTGKKQGFDEESINPGVRNLVQMLRQNHFNTVDSGDGKTGDFECDRGYPYVSILVENPSRLMGETYRLANLMRLCSVDLVAVGQGDIGSTGDVEIEASLDPVNNVGIIDLRGLNDEKLDKSIRGVR